MKVLILGATGLFGSALTTRMIKNGNYELNCPRLCRQYKNSLIGRKLNFKQQTDFVFQAESVLF